MPATESAPPSPSYTIPCPSCARLNRVRGDRAADQPRCGACGSTLSLDHPLPLDDATFDRVIGGTTLPVLVDFHADWCGPCQAMAPAVDALAREMVGRALVAKLDTERAPRTAQRFQIRGIPTVILFAGAREVRRHTGAVGLGELRRLIG